jgi:ACR3 family arsenite efflux pump ArsB
MFASQGSALLGNIGIFITLLPALVLFFGIIFCLSLLLGTLLKLPFKNIIPLVFTTSARNSPVALAIAAATFPMRPTIALVLVIGPLIELPALAIQSMLLKSMLLKKSRK